MKPAIVLLIKLTIARVSSKPKLPASIQTNQSAAIGVDKHSENTLFNQHEIDFSINSSKKILKRLFSNRHLNSTPSNINAAQSCPWMVSQGSRVNYRHSWIIAELEDQCK